MTLHVTLWLKEKKSGFSTGGEKIFQISSNTPLFLLFFLGGGLVSLIVGVVIIFGIHPAVLPSLSYTLWFGRFLQGFKGKLMHVVLFFCLFFNSWYLLVFLAFQT